MAYDEQADAQQPGPSGYSGYYPGTKSASGDPNQYQLKGGAMSGGMDVGPRRATAQDAIRNRINEYHLAINQLEALSRALPNELPLPADEILRELVLGY